MVSENENYLNPNLKSNLRLNFLNKWNQKYPQQSSSQYCGMIVFTNDQIRLEKNGSFFCEIQLNDSTQLEINDNNEFKPLEVLKSGDWVELKGQTIYKEKESLIMKVHQIFLLSPNLEEKGHCSQVNLNFRKWSQFQQKVKSFYYESEFDEIQTPTLVQCPGTEPFLDAFKTEFHFGNRREALYLPTSPEIHLKKCLAKGWERIFEIRPCFRNGELSPTHQPEFIMLEWYRAYSSLNEIKSDIQNLIKTLSPEKVQNQKWINKSMAELFEEILQFKLTPKTTAEELADLAQDQSIDVSKAKGFDDIFFYLFLEKIEPTLKNYQFLFLHSYPPSQAALARLTPEGWGDRFEFYINGLEIANAFNELNDPHIQRMRSHEDLNTKLTNGREMISLDEDFFKHLEKGMPPSCGIALGLERLFMALNGINNINKLRLFPIF